MKHILLFAAITLSLSTTALADNEISDTGVDANVDAKNSGWDYDLSLSYLSLSSSAASEQGLGNSGYALEIAGTYSFKSHFAASVGLAFANIKDDSGFSQRVVDQFNNVDVAESTATAIPLFAELQYKNTLPGDSGVNYRAGVGYTAITNASRDISNCINCFSSDFELEGGAYLSGSVGKNINAKSAVGLTARQYVSGDLENSVLLWWKINTRR